MTAGWSVRILQNNQRSQLTPPSEEKHKQDWSEQGEVGVTEKDSRYLFYISEV